MTAGVHCRLVYEFSCEACEARAEVVRRLHPDDPVLRPLRQMPLGWHVVDAHTLCPAHEIRVGDRP